MQNRFLCFVTASTALPRGQITVHKVGGGDFPVAHTCFSRLDMPEYDDVALVHTRLRYCIDHLEEAGFGLA